MTEPRAGRLTFLFTDIEGSTPLWDAAPEFAAAATAAHDRSLREQLAAHGGTLVKGTGDGALAVFTSADEALQAVVEFQRAMLAISGGEHPLRVRVALHTGEAIRRDHDYFGLAVAVCARVLAAIHGNQVCITGDTKDDIGNLPPGITLRRLGTFLLRGTTEPVELLQVEAPGLPTDFPALRAVEAFAHNLPAVFTSFVGRGPEMAQAAALIREARLTTFLGLGGSGKSRLAIEVARRMSGEFTDGVWLAELASLSDGAQVAASITRSLGIPEERDRTPLDALAARFAERRSLLILDNCEHLIEACAEVAAHLLEHCEGIKILATSRQRLKVPGEVTFSIPPLSLPRSEDLDSPESVGRSESALLFVERARLTMPGFELDTSNCRHIAQICRSVEGVPLAIELAAGRLATLPLERIAAGLAERISVLGGGTGPRRHETLERTIEWSYDTLDATEQRLFAELSVFRGGFELDSVTAVSALAVDPMEAVIGLAEKSMLIKDAMSGRYHFLEPVRLYAWQILQESGGTAEVQDRHAQHVAARLRPGAEAADHGRWMERVAAEHDNIRAALRWSLQQGDRQLALEIVGNAWIFWKHRGLVGEGREWLAAALEASTDSDPDLVLGALLGAGELAATQDDRVAAETYLERARDLAEGSDDFVTAAAAVRTMVSLPYRTGDLTTAARGFEEALSLARRGGDLSQVSTILAGLALVEEDQGRLEDAESHAAEALSLRKQTQDQYGVADALLTWAEISINRGRLDEASRALREALDIATRNGFQDIVAWGAAYRGKLEMCWGNTDEGVRLLEDSLHRFQERGQPNGAAWALRHLGRARLEQGDFNRAEGALVEALDLSVSHVIPDAPRILEALGELAVATGDPAHAAFVLGAARHHGDAMGLVTAVAEQSQSRAARAEVERAIGADRAATLAAEATRVALPDLPAVLAQRSAKRRFAPPVD